MVPSDLRSRAARLCRLRHDPQLFFPAPAPPPLNRRDHLDCRHRAMPIVTISIALGAHSAEKQGSHQRTLTQRLKLRASCPRSARRELKLLIFSDYVQFSTNFEGGGVSR